MFGSQRKKQEGQQRHQYDDAYMMAGCQLGRSPSVLAAHELLQTLDNTKKEKIKKKENKK